MDVMMCGDGEQLWRGYDDQGTMSDGIWQSSHMWYPPVCLYCT